MIDGLLPVVTVSAHVAPAVAVAETEATATETANVNVNVTVQGNATVSATAKSVREIERTRAGGAAALNGGGVLPLRGVGTTVLGPRHLLRMAKRTMIVPRPLLTTIKSSMPDIYYLDHSFQNS